jgi:hypothetical protein
MIKCNNCGLEFLDAKIDKVCPRCKKEVPELDLVHISYVRKQFNKFIETQEDIPHEIVTKINENFWELL